MEVIETLKSNDMNNQPQLGDTKSKVLTHFSLFTGIGGIDLAAEWAGFETIGQVEIDDYATKVLEKHWPVVTRFRDVRDVTGETIQTLVHARLLRQAKCQEQAAGIEQSGKAELVADTERKSCKEETQEWAERELNDRVKVRSINSTKSGTGITVLSGGFPCQPFSTAGKRKGTLDERNLWPEMRRIIGEARPRWVLGENVPGLFSIDAGWVFGEVVNDLAEMGYVVGWCCYGAVDVGALHRRNRVFIVAHSNSDGYVHGELSIKSTNTNEQTFSEPVTSDKQSAMAYANQQGSQRHGGLRERAGQWLTWSGSEPLEGIWQSEPDVGRSIDGFSSWLDGFDYIIPHMLLLAYGNAKKERPREILSTLRREVGEKVLRQCAGRSPIISEEKILLTYLCKLEETPNPLGNESLESAEAQERLLRSLWLFDKFTGSSYRSRPIKQFTREYSNSLQALSRLLAHHSQAAWQAYRGENAKTNNWDNTWELGIQRVASRIPARVDRLKCLGNAVVPQQIYPIFKAIATIEANLCKGNSK